MSKLGKFAGASMIALTLLAYNGEPINVYANSVENDEVKVDELEEEKVLIEEEIENKENEIEELILEVEMLEYNKTLIEDEIKINEDKLMKISEQIKKTIDEIKVLQDSIDEREAIIGERLKSYQLKGNIDYLDVLMGSEGIIDFFTGVGMLNTILEADNEIMEDFMSDLELVEKKLKEVKKMESDEQKVKKENEERKSELNEIIQSTIEKQNILDSEIEELNVSIEDIQKEQDELLEKINEALGMKVGLGSGELEWPTTNETYVSSGVGTRIHPKTKEVGSFHRGIDIARTNKSVVPPIYAAEDGVVVSAGVLGGYGNMVKIRHDNGLETLYGHLSSIGVTIGQEVRRGQTIGIMGTTGMSTGIHLHFEVTQDGNLQNPLRYLQ